MTKPTLETAVGKKLKRLFNGSNLLESKEGVQGGQVVFKGTRIRFQTVIDLISEERTTLEALVRKEEREKVNKKLNEDCFF